MIVLTGSIATGKSTVSRLLHKHGYKIVDADLIAKELIDTKVIQKLFGVDFIKNGEIDRVALSKLIFDNPKERKKLNNYIHPLIREEIYRQSKSFKKRNLRYIADIPLYFESGHYDADLVCTVYCPIEKQIKRLMQRDALDKIEAIRRIKSQISIEEKRKKADYVIDNSKDEKYLLEQTKNFIRYMDANFKI